MITRCSLFLLTVLQVACVSASRAGNLSGTKPNIILVLTDDQGMGELSCLGNPVLKTPNLDRFYERATRFTEMHVSPSCAPSRAAMLSGMHEFKSGVTHTLYYRERLALSTVIFPQLLQEAGYATGIFGKWHLGDEREYRPSQRGFDESFIHGTGGIGQYFEGLACDFPVNRENKYFDNVLLHNEVAKKTKGYCTDVFFDAALGWIRKQQAAEQPYFAYLSLNAPHGPMIAPPKLEKKWEDLGWGGPIPGRYGMIENIDENFGRLFDQLGEWGALENTLIIFMTDNGQSTRTGLYKKKKVPVFAGGFKTGKGSAFEGGTHVPCFFYWKGRIAEGRDIPNLASGMDFYPTFCELAGVDLSQVDQESEGRSLVPLLEAKSATPPARRKVFIHRGRWKVGVDPQTHKFVDCAVRTQRWRLVNNTELYDITNDPYEAVNVIGDHPKIVEKLRRSYQLWWEEVTPFIQSQPAPEPPKTLPFEELYNRQMKATGIPDWQP